jgi:hypothetical protein
MECKEGSVVQVNDGRFSLPPHAFSWMQLRKLTTRVLLLKKKKKTLLSDPCA